jgi:hypothetical protein
VARTGPLRPHDPETLYSWPDRFLAEVAKAPVQIVALYQDEPTFHRRPTVTNAYASIGTVRG